MKCEKCLQDKPEREFITKRVFPKHSLYCKECTKKIKDEKYAIYKSKFQKVKNHFQFL